LRTLPVRMKQHEADALRVAEFLAGHPAVRRVHHPALTEDRELAERQLTGYSGLFSFDLVRDDFDSVARVINSLRRFHIGVSWGGFESLVISPRRPNNDAYLDNRRIPRGLIRISVGLEGADALIEDLARALEAVT
ncbi:MAG TPA: PLP-dependent transferase, partial [Nannocystis sp.]